jgi:threonine aldolase
MGNTIALKVHTQHGQEVICESRSHIMNYELSMLAWFAGCLARTILAENGLLTWAKIQPEIRTISPHWAPTGLIEIENTHNVGGGHCYPLADIDEIGRQARARGLSVHMDGARLFNAAAATGDSAARIAREVDTVMFCLSKGLGAPVGSILAGPKATIANARFFRKRLGGGMRQAGMLAAAGIYALENHTTRLAEDHANARFLAGELAQLTGLRISGHMGPTNIVMIDVSATAWNASEWCQRLKAQGVLLSQLGDYLIRAVTHYDVDRAACEQAVQHIKEVWRSQ